MACHLSESCTGVRNRSTVFPRLEELLRGFYKDHAGCAESHGCLTEMPQAAPRKRETTPLADRHLSAVIGGVHALARSYDITVCSSKLVQ
mmetsp:Transcript_902/g.2873  ORF Transcript_902/g.2873 Transcript_902/m.2873 type:complete len:90 (-) Transcript_902:532-801(-)